MIRIIITSIMATTKRLFSQSNPNSFFFGMVDGEPARGERVPHCSLFFHGLLAGSQGYIHQTPSAPIVSLHLRSSDDLHGPFRPFMHMFKYRPSRKFFASVFAPRSFCLSRNNFANAERPRRESDTSLLSFKFSNLQVRKTLRYYSF